MKQKFSAFSWQGNAIPWEFEREDVTYDVRFGGEMQEI